MKETVKSNISVNVTPNGWGDAVVNDKVFVKPEERRMSMTNFFEMIENKDYSDGIPYISHQNDSLRKQFPELLKDIPSSISLSEVLLHYIFFQFIAFYHESI